MSGGSKSAPVRLTRAYRRIPVSVRGVWTLGGRLGSSSGSALAQMERAACATEAWRIFARAAVPHMKDGIPWWMDG